jgi:hypothetical protein
LKKGVSFFLPDCNLLKYSASVKTHFVTVLVEKREFLTLVLLQCLRNFQNSDCRNKKMIKKILLIAVSGSLMTACATNTPYYGQNYGQTNMSKAAIGGGIGAVTGAAIGSAFGGNDLANVGLGALAGGAVGAAVGAYVDHNQQQKKQQQQQGGWYQNPPYGYNQ